MTSNKPHYSERAPEPVGPYPHAIDTGDLVFISGMGPRVRGSSGIPGGPTGQPGNEPYSIAEQTRAALQNVDAILKELSMDVANIVDVTVFLTDMANDFQGFNKVYAEYFVNHKPARTTVEVSALPTQIAVELKVIARR